MHINLQGSQQQQLSVSAISSQTHVYYDGTNWRIG